MSGPTVGLALIAKDEADNLPRLLASIEGAFDRVVLLDTGSTDDTVKVFQEWARAQAGLTFSVADFIWCDDFAAARRAADSLLVHGAYPCAEPLNDPRPLVDWTSWADGDDTIVGAHNLRALAAQTPPGTNALVFDYLYAVHPETGETICTLKRERLVRASHAGLWAGHVHEAQVIPGTQQLVSPGIAHWRHHKQEVPEAVGKSNGRNLRILRDWVKSEPENARVLAYLGTELALTGKPARVRQSIGYFKRFLKLHTDWDDERAQVCRRLGVALIALERFDEAERYALQAIATSPGWPDSFLTLAEVSLARDQPTKTKVHAERALAMGMPAQSLLILNPMDYAVHPHRLLAGACGGMGQWDDAVRHADVVLAHEPGDVGIQQARASFAESAKKDHTTQTYLLAAKQLVDHDEQTKALMLLTECVPYFVTDHPQIVGARAELRQRLAWLWRPDGYAEHYQTGGSKPEDFHGDEMIEPICQALPRVAFLLHGLQEQVAA